MGKARLRRKLKLYSVSPYGEDAPDLVWAYTPFRALVRARYGDDLSSLTLEESRRICLYGYWVDVINITPPSKEEMAKVDGDYLYVCNKGTSSE